MSDLQIIYHDEAQLLDYGESRGAGPWVKLRLADPEDLAKFRGLDTATSKKAGHIFNLTISQGDIIQDPEPEPKPEGSNIARRLHQNGFFYVPAVLKALGSDAEFRDWVERQPSCISGGFNDFVNGDGHNIACHVRRSHNSGVGEKPEYSCVPMTHEEHHYQHQYGEKGVLEKYMRQPYTVQEAKDWFDGKRNKYVHDWGHMRLKEILGLETLTATNCSMIKNWAEANQIGKYLPLEVKC